jgi:hypothetical protein
MLARVSHRDHDGTGANSPVRAARFSAAPENRRWVARWKRLLEGVIQGTVEMLLFRFCPPSALGRSNSARMFALLGHGFLPLVQMGFWANSASNFALARAVGELS